MLYLHYDTPDKLTPVNNIELAFSGLFFPDFGCRDKLDNEYSKELLQLIDRAVKIDKNIITTRFGTAGMTDLSSGCKSALIAINRPDLIVSNLEMGNNVLVALAEVTNKYNVDAHIRLDILKAEILSKEPVSLNGEITTGVKAMSDVANRAWEKYVNGR